MTCEKSSKTELNGFYPKSIYPVICPSQFLDFRPHALRKARRQGIPKGRSYVIWRGSGSWGFPVPWPHRRSVEWRLSFPPSHRLPISPTNPHSLFFSRDCRLNGHFGHQPFLLLDLFLQPRVLTLGDDLLLSPGPIAQTLQGSFLYLFRDPGRPFE